MRSKRMYLLSAVMTAVLLMQPVLTAGAAREADFYYEEAGEDEIFELPASLEEEYEEDEAWIEQDDDGYADDDRDAEEALRDPEVLIEEEAELLPEEETEPAAFFEEETEPETPGYGGTAGGFCGAEGDNLSWSLDASGVLTISGQGYMESFAVEAPWAAYGEDITKAVIRRGVKNVGHLAFAGLSGLSEVVLEEGLEEISGNAFSDCGALTGVDLPDSLLYIEEEAFANCISLKELYCPEGLKGIEARAFYGCTSLKAVSFPDNKMFGIGKEAFYGCTGLEEVKLPLQPRLIYPDAFAGGCDVKYAFYPGDSIAWKRVEYDAAFTGLEYAVFHFEARWHTGVEEGPGVPSTCVREGMSPAVICSVCGEELEEQKSLPLAPHTWGAWTVTKQATYSEAGERAHSCTVCGVTETEEIEVRALPFTDVRRNSPFVNAIGWAVEQGITAGTNKAGTLFSPDATCTRGQVVTFLWRAAGRPGHVGGNPFKDVQQSSPFYDAILWAVEHGITAGSNKAGTLFSPDAPCTRGQVVTFLWRASGNPGHAEGNPFKDVRESSPFYDAILWAAERGVTAGTNKEGTLFSPGASCTRGQIVTFLYRNKAAS